MFTIEITTEFAAAHAIVIAGRREPVHGHNWHVTARISGPALDADGLLCDFHTAHGVLVDIVAPFHNNDLNATPPFDETNPTAERVAEHVARELAARLEGSLAGAARIESVRVTESPGCAAVYYPDA